MSLTPMMQQYMDIKKQHQDKLVMFRLGDFYELFFDDAVTASRELDITLTGREAGESGRAPMCGVPYHAIEQYLGRLIDKGYKVAICEQMEDPKITKGLVRREVVRIVTPGTALRDNGELNCFLASVAYRKGIYGIAMIDVGTGEVFIAQTESTDTISEQILCQHPREILIDSEFASSEQMMWLNRLCGNEAISLTVHDADKSADYNTVVTEQYRVSSLLPLELLDKDMGVCALGMGLLYILHTQKFNLPHLQSPQNLLLKSVLHLDLVAMRNLELLETARSRDKKGSLLDLIDKTKTAIGGRTLRRWLENPLQSVEKIQERLDAVENLITDVFMRENLAKSMQMVHDLERLLGKLSYGSANARDMLAISKSLAAVSGIHEAVLEANSPLIGALVNSLPDLSDILGRIDETIVIDPPVSVRDGNIIRDGADDELDKLRQVNRGGKSWLTMLEQRERERTGIKNLKIGYNKVFGYYLEVSKSNLDLVPDDYERRQTLSTGERYILPELKQREAEILHAEEMALAREFELFSGLVTFVLMHRDRIQIAAKTIGELDALYAFSVASNQYHYNRPNVVNEPGIHIVNGRHPMVEAMHQSRFVPNTIQLTKDAHLILLTGPNMGGKSTYMRQTALIILLAHIGCFVPADSAKIGIVDRIFTRIGASDDLSAGQSTFMVEMTELAQILRHATDRSFVILDEIGRGTSTYDGLSIAEAVVESLQIEGRRPFTIFATHYHELTAMAEQFPGVKNYSVAVQEKDGDVIFLHTVIPAPADKSYGIAVARLAGLPKAVVDRAVLLLQMREHAEAESSMANHVHVYDHVLKEEAAASLADKNQVETLPLFHVPYDLFIEEVKAIDILRLTPLDAMTVLYQLIGKAKEL